MSGSATPPLDGDDAILALEWALGLLTGARLESAEARREADPAFRREGDRWAERWAALFDEPAIRLPPAALWERVAAEIGDVPAPGVIAGPPRPPLPPGGGLRRPVAWAPLWSSLALWRTAAAAAAALALALLVTRPATLPVAPPAPVALPPLGALLAGDDEAPEGPARLTAAVAQERILLGVVELVPGAGRQAQLWLIPADGTPRSLGVIGVGGVQQVIVPPTLVALLADGATLAVSLEPPGGSPTGAPTGPVVASGELVPL